MPHQLTITKAENGYIVQSGTRAHVARNILEVHQLLNDWAGVIDSSKDRLRPCPVCDLKED